MNEDMGDARRPLIIRGGLVLDADRFLGAADVLVQDGVVVAIGEPGMAAPDGAPAEDEPLPRLAFAPTMDDADQAIADALRENGLFQLLTDDLNSGLAMPRPVTALLTQCGEAKAFYNADRGEAVLCYEMLGALVKAAP